MAGSRLGEIPIQRRLSPRCFALHQVAFTVTFTLDLVALHSKTKGERQQLPKQGEGLFWTGAKFLFFWSWELLELFFFWKERKKLWELFGNVLFGGGVGSGEVGVNEEKEGVLGGGSSRLHPNSTPTSSKRAPAAGWNSTQIPFSFVGNL